LLYQIPPDEGEDTPFLENQAMVSKQLRIPVERGSLKSFESKHGICPNPGFGVFLQDQLAWFLSPTHRPMELYASLGDATWVVSGFSAITAVPLAP
jgi:hypothetical protein